MGTRLTAWLLQRSNAERTSWLSTVAPVLDSVRGAPAHRDEGTGVCGMDMHGWGHRDAQHGCQAHSTRLPVCACCICASSLLSDNLRLCIQKGKGVELLANYTPH